MSSRLRGQGPPDLLSRESQYRSHQLCHGNENLKQHRLRSSTQRRICSERIQPIFQNIEVDRAQIHRAKVVECVEDRMKLKIVVGLTNPCDQFTEPMQSPTIQLRQLLIRHTILYRK